MVLGCGNTKSPKSTLPGKAYGSSAAAAKKANGRSIYGNFAPKSELWGVIRMEQSSVKASGVDPRVGEYNKIVISPATWPIVKKSDTYVP